MGISAACMIGRQGVPGLLIGLLFMAAEPAQSQLGGAWVDEYGRNTTFIYPNAPNLTLETGDRTAEQIASAFDSFCLRTAFQRNAVEEAVERSGWGMAYVAAQMPFKPPAEIGGWRTRDAVLHVTDGSRFPKPAQCSLVVQSRAVGPLDALVEAVSAALGLQPANADKKFKKNGKPEKYWRPEWRPVVGAAAGQVVIAGKNPAVRGGESWQLAVYTPRAARRRAGG